MKKITQYKVGILYDEYGNIEKSIAVKRNQDMEAINIRRNITENQLKYLERKRNKSELDKVLGGYIHMSYVKNELLFNKIPLGDNKFGKIKTANISRLIYLSTYLDYNSNKEGMLVRYGQFREIVPLKRQDIFKMLKLGESAFNDFLSDVKNNNILYVCDGKYYLNTSYFNKGNCNFDNNEYTRIYINTTRNLYENSSARSHKQLSYVFQLIPKLHKETNIILYDPSVINISNENKMSLIDICEFLGVSHNKGNGKKMLNGLLKFKVKIDNTYRYLFKYITVAGHECKRDYFVVNPNVIWSGNEMGDSKIMIEKLFFED